MDTTIRVWRCDGCGEMLPGPYLDLDMARCKCRTGQWRVCSVAATIGESTERARKAEQERDALAAANLAANKRIVELEHERDEWMRRAQGWESEAAIATERFSQLSAAQPGEPLDLDCGDSSCAFAKTRGGMRTNGGCRCLENLGFCRGQTDFLRRMAAEIVSLRKRLLDLTTPRPIAEAPRDGTWVLCKSSAGWKEGQFCGLNFDPPNCLGWFGRDNRELRRVTDYLPLPEVKP